jgi:hypothetical protein
MNVPDCRVRFVLSSEQAGRGAPPWGEAVKTAQGEALGMLFYANEPAPEGRSESP